MRRAAVLVTAFLALAAGVSTAGAQSLRAARSVESSINAMRAQHGCGPLRLHVALSLSAGKQARLLLADGELDHDAGSPMPQRLHRAVPSASLLGEDLAWGTGSDARPSSIVQGWMDSPMHRADHARLPLLAPRRGHRRRPLRRNPARTTVYAADFAA